MSARAIPSRGVVRKRVVDAPRTFRMIKRRVEGVKGRVGRGASREWTVVNAGRKLRRTEKRIEGGDCGRRGHWEGVGKGIFFHYVLQIGKGKIGVRHWGSNTRATRFRVKVLGWTWQMAKRTRRRDCAWRLSRMGRIRGVGRTQNIHSGIWRYLALM